MKAQGHTSAVWEACVVVVVVVDRTLAEDFECARQQRVRVDEGWTADDVDDLRKKFVTGGEARENRRYVRIKFYPGRRGGIERMGKTVSTSHI